MDLNVLKNQLITPDLLDSRNVLNINDGLARSPLR